MSWRDEFNASLRRREALRRDPAVREAVRELRAPGEDAGRRYHRLAREIASRSDGAYRPTAERLARLHPGEAGLARLEGVVFDTPAIKAAREASLRAAIHVALGGPAPKSDERRSDPMLAFWTGDGLDDEERTIAAHL